MNTRTRIIARVGTFGSSENPQTVTLNDLSEIVQSFETNGVAPIILGHSFGASSPRFGEVIKLKLDGENLVAEVSEHDVLSQAVDAGYYPDVSIGAKRSAETGKLYLHHLAYLGEEPPAIKDLRNKIQTDLQAIAASDKLGVITFPTITGSLLKLKLSDQGDTMNELAMLKEQLAQLEKENAELKEKLRTSGDGNNSDELQNLKAENEQLKAKLKTLQEKYPDDVSLSDASPEVKALLKELRKTKRESLLALCDGKVTPACTSLIALLADHLPTSEITLSDGKVLSHYDLLFKLVENLPELSLGEQITLSDSQAQTQDKNQKRVSAFDMMKNI